MIGFLRRAVLCTKLICSIALCTLAVPASSQEELFDGGEWNKTSIARDVIFRARGEQVVRPASDRVPERTFFVSYGKLGPEDKQYGARMVCYAGIVRKAASPQELDLRARYLQFAKNREASGYSTDRIVMDDRRGVRQLHAEGQRDDPHEHFVVSLIVAVKDGTAVSVTRSCTFTHPKIPIPKTDFVAYVLTNTKVDFLFSTQNSSERM